MRDGGPLTRFAVNGIAPGILAIAAAKMLGLIWFTCPPTTSSTVSAGPYTEDAVPNPRGVYALTKHIGEQAVRRLAASWAIARTAVVYGWPPAGRPTLAVLAARALRRRNTGASLRGPVRLAEPCRQRRRAARRVGRAAAVWHLEHLRR